MTETTVNNYNENAIQVLEGLEAVRKRPGMYIGSTDSRGLHHLVWEIVDNSVDEALSGFGDTIEVTIESGKNNDEVPFDNDYITVRDYGRGVPTGQHTTGKSTPEVIFTVLHAGGKFGQGGYKSSGGLHGVGSSVVNALSKYMSVRIWRDNKEHFIEFENGGHLKSDLKVVGKATTEQTGTKVLFQPDEEIFSSLNYKFDTIIERLRETAFLMKGMKIILTDNRKAEPKTEILHYENGIADYIKYLNEKEDVITPVEFFEGLDKDTGIEFDLALQWNETESDHVTSFVNNVKTPDGGTHEAGFRTAINKAVNEVAKEKNLLKKGKKLESKDILSGLVGIVSVRVPEQILQFVGQTKSKLGTAEARGAVEKFLYEKLKHYLMGNPTVSDVLIKKAIRALEIREALKKAKEKIKNDSKGKKALTYSDKLTKPTQNNKKKNELYLVEGDSAGGSAKQGRDKTFQGILALRGKVTNTHDISAESALANLELSTLVYALGAGIGNDFDESELNYDKVVIMTDADVDGAHIQCLLLTFFIKFMPDLIKGGHLFIAKPPLYKLTSKKFKDTIGVDHEYYWDKAGYKGSILENKLKENEYTLQRYKGLGEMNADQLFETTMDPDNRILTQVSISNYKQTLDTLRILMGNDASVRKSWIDDNVDFEVDF